MAIQPIDLQLTMNRATEVNKVNTENQRYSADQQAFNSELQKHVDQELRQVVQSDKSEGKKIKDQQQGEKGKYKKNNNKRKNSGQTEEKVVKNKSTSLFDVSI